MRGIFKKITVEYKEWGNVEVNVYGGKGRRNYRLTEASYNRLVWLANNGGYHITFGRMGDDSFAWSLMRTYNTPSKPTPFFPSQSMADPYAMPLANPHQCQVEPDGDILFA